MNRRDLPVGSLRPFTKALKNIDNLIHITKKKLIMGGFIKPASHRWILLLDNQLTGLCFIFIKYSVYIDTPW